METGSFAPRAHHYFNLFIHEVPASSTTGGLRAVLVHPNAFLLASSFGINVDNSENVNVYCQSTQTYSTFVMDVDAAPKHKMILSLEEYVNFLKFLINIWPDQKQELIKRSDLSQGPNHYQIGPNLFCFGTAETIYTFPLSQDLVFEAWNEVNFSDNLEALVKYHCRFRRADQTMWMDFHVLTDLASTGVLAMINKTYNGQNSIKKTQHKREKKTA